MAPSTVSALMAARCDLNHDSTIRQIAEIFSPGKRGGSRSSTASTLWNSVQISANGKGISSAATPKASDLRSCLHSSYLCVLLLEEDKCMVYQMLHKNHMIACSDENKDETNEMLCLLKLRRAFACRSRHLSVACARDQMKPPDNFRSQLNRTCFFPH